MKEITRKSRAGIEYTSYKFPSPPAPAGSNRHQRRAEAARARQFPALIRLRKIFDNQEAGRREHRKAIYKIQAQTHQRAVERKSK